MGNLRAFRELFWSCAIASVRGVFSLENEPS